MVFPVTLFFFLGEDMPDFWVDYGGVFSKVAETAVITLVPVIHITDLVEGDIKSVHTEDDSTSYQNTTGNDAVVSFSIQASNAGGTATRHVKVYSSPNNDSTSGATLLFEYGTASSSFFDTAGDNIGLSNLRIQNNHFLVIENVDDSRAGPNHITINSSRLFFVREYTNI